MVTPKPSLALVFVLLLPAPSCHRAAEEVARPLSAEEDLALPPPGECDWPWWRGPGRDGKAVGPPPPLTWSPTMNVIWKAEVTGRGQV